MCVCVSKPRDTYKSPWIDDPRGIGEIALSCRSVGTLLWTCGGDSHPRDTYKSPWVGDPRGIGETVIGGGDGTIAEPVVVTLEA